MKKTDIKSANVLNQFSRTELLIGKEGVDKLKKSKIAVFGIGGVGSFVVEGLVRSGVSNLVLIDNDTVDLTNLNRQLIATRKTIGKYKVDVMKERILEINPDAKVETYKEFFMPDSKTEIIKEDLSYVVDCIDTVTAKIEIIKQCNRLSIPIISSMGTGNKLDPSKLKITDIYKTNICPLAKVMRKELRKRDISKLKVIYSEEEPITPDEKIEEICKEEGTKKKQVPGSVSFVPSVAGLMIAGEIVIDIIKL